MYTIYKITNILNGKPYIGYTIEDNPQTRFKRHLYESRLYPDRHLYRAMKKDGVENFVFEILKQGEDCEWGLKVEEPYYIALYDSKRNGYNMTEGGDGSVGWIPTVETIANMRKAQLGTIHSPERRQKNSDGRKGKKLSGDHCGAISKSLTGRKLSIQHRKNIKGPVTAEHKEKIRRARLGVMRGPYKKKSLPSTIS